MRLAIFRPRRLLERSVEYCESKGMEVAAAPSIDLYPQEGMMHRFLDEMKRRDPDVVVLTSQNSIKLMQEELGDEVVEELKKRTVAAIGSKTLESLEELGVDVDVVPDTFSSTGMVEALEPYEGSLVFVARSDKGDERLFDAREFLDMEEFQVYRVGLPRDVSPIREVQDETLEGRIDAFAFTSTMTVKNFLRVAREDDREREVKEVLRGSTVAALGHPTEETLEEFGVGVDVVPEIYTFEGLADAVAAA